MREAVRAPLAAQRARYAEGLDHLDPVPVYERAGAPRPPQAPASHAVGRGPARRLEARNASLLGSTPPAQGASRSDICAGLATDGAPAAGPERGHMSEITLPAAEAAALAGHEAVTNAASGRSTRPAPCWRTSATGACTGPSTTRVSTGSFPRPPSHDATRGLTDADPWPHAMSSRGATGRCARCQLVAAGAGATVSRGGSPVCCSCTVAGRVAKSITTAAIAMAAVATHRAGTKPSMKFWPEA